MCALDFSADRMRTALDQLRILGCWDNGEKPKNAPPPRPEYTQSDLEAALSVKDSSFRKFVGDVQCRLGRTLSTEELKILLGFLDYLRMPTEVASLLVAYCVERNRQKGTRTPSMRSIEKEAYHWSDENIDSMETALQYIQTQNQIRTRISRLRHMMQIDDRKLTSAEEQYLTRWIGWGFPDDVIRLAYEKTCLNTGGLKWAYMNSILSAWQEKGLHTVQDINLGDGAPKRKNDRGMYQTHSNTTLSPLEREAIASALEEG